MAENQTEDDDDEGFGDFKFASSSSYSYTNNNTIHSNHVNSSDFFTNRNDDEWGDFINHSFSQSQITPQSHLSNGFSLNNSNNDKAFGFFSPQLAPTRVESESESESESANSVPSRVELEKKKDWVKPQGALPLSLFGDLEEEEEGSGVSDANTDLSTPKRVDSVRNGSSVSPVLGIDDIIANLYKQSEQNKVENGSNSNRLNQGEQIKVECGWNSNSNELDSNLNGSNSFANLYNQSEQIKADNGLNANSNGSNWANLNVNELILDSNGSNLNESELISDSNGLNSNVNGLSGLISGSNELNSNIKALDGLDLNVKGSVSNIIEGNDGTENDDDDDDDDGWEFKAAVSESDHGVENSKEEGNSGLLGLEVEATTIEIQVDGKGQTNSEVVNYSVGFGSSAHSSNDLFASSNGFSYKSSEMDFGFAFGFEPSAVVQNENGFLSKSFSESKLNETGNVVNSFPTHGNVDSDENLWEFKDAFSETESKHKEEAKVADLSGAGVDVSIVDGEVQINKTSLENHEGALPLSLFSDGKLEFDNSMIHHDVLAYKPPSHPRNGLNSHGSGISFDDLLNLYSQAEKTPSVDSSQKPTVNGLVSTEIVFDSNLVNGNDDFDDNSWEFKDAFSDAEAKDQTSVLSLRHTHQNVDSTQKPIVNGLVSTETVLDSNLVDGDDDFDDNSWKFKDVFLDAGAKDQTSVLSLRDTHLNVDSTQKPAVNGLVSTETMLDSNLLDGDDDFDDNSWEFKDAVLDAGAKDRTSVLSPRDTHLNVDSTQKPAVNGLVSTETVLDSNLLDGDDDFDDNSWEFKDVFPDAGAKDQSSVLSLGDTHQNVSTQLKAENYVDFYSKLKDELGLVVLCHLDSLKKAKTSATLSGEDAKAVAFDEEIQKAYKELHQENVVSEAVCAENHPPRINCLNEFLEVLHEPKFQVLESEYHLSRRLSLAEKDLRSAIDLLKHATSILKVLAMASMEEQSSYVSTWFKVISVCAQELKHGASIWKQTLQKSIHGQMLSDPRGQQFILALGEIYRIIEIIGASAKLYKPWILSSFADPKSIFTLLEECYTLWSSSGLEEALQSLSDPTCSEYDGTVKTILESIKHIHDLDMHLQNPCLAKQETICRLSVLTSTMVPDMKMVVWNGEQYFLTLANLWANLISCHPPSLPHIIVG